MKESDILGYIVAFVAGAIAFQQFSKRYPNSALTRNLAKDYPAEKMVSHIQTLVSEHPQKDELKDALVVRLLDGTTIGGRFVKDVITSDAKQGLARLGMFTTVYPWAKSGAVCIPFHRSEEGKIYVAALFRTQSKKPGEVTELIVSQGFAAHSILGEEHFTKRDNMDAAEVELFNSPDGYRTIPPVMPPKPYVADANHWMAALRELEEETGFKASREVLYPICHHQSQRRADRPSFFVTYFLADIKRMQPITPKDTDEIKGGLWIDTSIIPRGDKSESFTIDGKLYQFKEVDYQIFLAGLHNYTPDGPVSTATITTEDFTAKSFIEQTQQLGSRQQHG